MIPWNHGSNLFQDSSLNRTPTENCYISGYKGQISIFQDCADRTRTVIYVVKVSNLDDETGTHGIPHKYVMLNSPEIRHLGKIRISPNWWNQFFSNLWGWKEDILGYLGATFQTHRSCNFGDTIETRSRNWRKLGHRIFCSFDHSFGKMSILLSSSWGGASFYPDRLLSHWCI